jgi:carbon monoxide dehydrogenase subunit G
MTRTYKIIFSLVVLGVLAVIIFYVVQQRRAQKAGLLTENIEHKGDTWNADFTARIGAPEGQVFDAIRNIEKAHSDEIKSVQVISQAGNEKTVEMQVAGPGGQTLTTRLAFQYFPQQHRITYHTVDGGDFDTQAEYNLGDEGASTLMKFHETTKVAQALPVPDGVVKQVIRGIFLAQLEGLKKALNINTADTGDEDSDEP